MQLEWDGKVGPASIVSLLGALAVLITVGMMWQAQVSKTDAAKEAAAEAKAAVVEQATKSNQRDAVINNHSVALTRIETQMGFINPALQRIEMKLNAPKP